MEAVDRQSDFAAVGYDVDPAAVELTLSNARKAGVIGCIRAEQRDIADFVLPEGKVTVVTNPPYGERLLDEKGAEALYRTMGRVFPARPYTSYYVICPHERFESLFGRKADRRRKLYNGMLQCQMYMYFKW